MQLCPSLPTPWKCDSSLPWPWAGKQGLWVSSGSTPPRYVTLAVSVPLQASVSLFKFRGGLGQVARGGSGEGLGLGGQAAKEVSATAPSAGRSLPAPGPRGPCRPRAATSAAHEATIKGKRWQVVEPNLVIWPAGRRAGCVQLPPRASRLRRGPRGGWAFRNVQASPKDSWVLGRGRTPGGWGGLAWGSSQAGDPPQTTGSAPPTPLSPAGPGHFNPGTAEHRVQAGAWLGGVTSRRRCLGD